MSIDSGQHIHRNASAFRVLFRRECRDAYEISNCSDLEKSRSRNLKDCVQHGAWGGASTSRNPFVPQKRNGWVFRICIYRCIACDYLFVGMLAIVFYILVCYDINNVVYRIVYNEEDVTWQLQTIF